MKIFRNIKVFTAEWLIIDHTYFYVMGTRAGDMERIPENLCEGVGEDAPILLPFALFSGKSSSGVFLSPTEIFPGLQLSHLPWSRLMMRRRRGTCTQSCFLSYFHSSLSCLLAETQSSSLKGCGPSSALSLCSTLAVYFTLTENLRMNTWPLGQE